jgi:dTDP-4-dehydrorhamnose reductase
VVDDQWGSPTSAADLADAILLIILRQTIHKSGLYGVYNFANSGTTTWYGFATAIKELSGSNCVLHPVPTSKFSTPARRPLNSVLDTTRIQKDFNLTIPGWKDSLQKCMAALY